MAKKIKLNGFEGEIDDLIKICSEGNIELAELMNVKKQTKIPIWVIVFCALLFCISCFFSWFFRDTKITSMIFNILSIALLGTTSIQIHLTWKNYVATVISVIFGVSIFSICLGVLTPKEAVDKIEQSIINTK